MLIAEFVFATFIMNFCNKIALFGVFDTMQYHAVLIFSPTPRSTYKACNHKTQYALCLQCNTLTFYFTVQS